MPDQTPSPRKNFFDFAKDYVALAIVVFSFTVLIILIKSAFKAGNTDDKVFQSIKDIIGLFLPILGTWMGTVLAFYFTKQNFEAANKSIQQTIDKLTATEKLQATKAEEVMIPFNKIDLYPYQTGETWNSVSVSKYIIFLDEKKRNRLVLFDANNVLQYVIHKSTLNDFLYSKYSEGIAKEEVDKLTLQELTADKDIKEKIQNSVDFISKHATLFEAQQRMITNDNCSDVFITASGRKSEAIIGWVTNVIVAECLQIK